MPLLDNPHHDGSPVYVRLSDESQEVPTLGSVVALQMASNPADPIDAVWIRTTYDAEPTFHPCTRGDDGSLTGAIPVHNPVTHYRFLIVRGASHEWLTGAGLADRDVPDAYDFKLSAHPAAPAWGRDGVVYQIFPDRFARSASAGARDARLGRAGGLGRRGDLRARRPSYSAPALRRRPRRHRRPSRPRRRGGCRHRLHDAGLRR